MSRTASATPATASAVSWKSTAAAAVIGAVSALIVNSIIAFAGRAIFDIPSDFRPLTLPAFGFLTVVGAVVGAIGWHLIATRSKHATTLLRKLVPTVVVLSLLADVPLLVTDFQPGTTTAGVILLMCMHVGVALAAVPAYRRFIPPQS